MRANSVSARKTRFPLSIADAANEIGVTPEALRYYERQGVVAPIRFGRNQCRLYLEEDIEQIKTYRATLGKK